MAQNHIYRTAKGREIDMGKLISQNELVPAVGNMQVNARGDKSVSYTHLTLPTNREV